MKKDPSSAPAAVAAAKALIGLAADRKAALPDRLWAVAQLHALALPPSAPADERLRRASDRRTSTRFALMAIVDALPAAGIPDGHLEVFWDLIHLLEDLDTQINTHDLLEIAGKRGPKKSERILRQRGGATAAVEILMSRASWTEESALRWVANRIKGWEAASEVKRRELWKAIQDWRGDARDGGDDMDRLLFRRALASCVRSPNIPAEKLAGMLTAAPPGQIRSFPLYFGAPDRQRLSVGAAWCHPKQDETDGRTFSRRERSAHFGWNGGGDAPT